MFQISWSVDDVIDILSSFVTFSLDVNLDEEKEYCVIFITV